MSKHFQLLVLGCDASGLATAALLAEQGRRIAIVPYEVPKFINLGAFSILMEPRLEPPLTQLAGYHQLSSKRSPYPKQLTSKIQFVTPTMRTAPINSVSEILDIISLVRHHDDTHTHDKNLILAKKNTFNLLQESLDSYKIDSTILSNGFKHLSSERFWAARAATQYWRGNKLTHHQSSKTFSENSILLQIAHALDLFVNHRSEGAFAKKPTAPALPLFGRALLHLQQGYVTETNQYANKLLLERCKNLGIPFFDHKKATALYGSGSILNELHLSARDDPSDLNRPHQKDSKAHLSSDSSTEKIRFDYLLINSKQPIDPLVKSPKLLRKFLKNSSASEDSATTSHIISQHYIVKSKVIPEGMNSVVVILPPPCGSDQQSDKSRQLPPLLLRISPAIDHSGKQVEAHTTLTLSYPIQTHTSESSQKNGYAPLARLKDLIPFFDEHLVETNDHCVVTNTTGIHNTIGSHMPQLLWKERRSTGIKNTLRTGGQRLPILGIEGEILIASDDCDELNRRAGKRWKS